MIDYMTCLSSCFSTTFAVCTGDPNVYNNIVWVDGDPLPDQATMDASRFSALQNSAISALSDICANIITSGFISSALGTPHLYDSEDVDQINLIGATTTTAPSMVDPNGTAMYYAVREIVNGVTLPKNYTLHTYDQFRQVMTDGANYKLALLMNFNIKRYYISIATTPEQVEAITWSSNP